MINVFALGDARRLVSQPLQQTIMRTYATENNLSIDFVGWEIALWGQHKMLMSYINNRKANAFLFFTLYQFWDSGNFQQDVMNEIVTRGFPIYFASERIKILNIYELQSLNYELSIAEILSGYKDVDFYCLESL